MTSPHSPQPCWTKRALLGAAALLAAACSTGANIQIDGSIVNDRYVHPEEAFAVDVPALFKEGAAIEDEYAGPMGSVSFRDGLGQLIRVDVLFAESEQQREFLLGRGDSDDWREPLYGMRDATAGTIAASGVVPQLLGQDTVEIARDGQGQGGGTLQALHFTMLLPKGSSMVSVDGASTEQRRLDAYRFFLAFRRDTALYMLSSQHSVGLFGSAQEEAPLAEIQQTHRMNLEALAAGMTFGGDA